MVGVIEIDNYG